ncbi:hypothetical protein JHK82_031450 [Glycine max]|nr:hypothetical protein JHK85_032108 [Glycine max]KAG4994716.1 hypothetical protein JHK86_031543 [Glycine max]KAG5124713.1 hypothetical protein JHK82_031450 [Glycine max]KAG5146134.1 hypothetical protein JHK84_031677 [Glycine max]
MRSRNQSVTIDFPCDFLGISMLEQPNKYYFIICGHKIVLEVDSSILLIMEKLQSYNSKVALHFKCVYGLAGATADVHYYDVLTNKWSRITPFREPPTPRATHLATVVGTMVVIQVAYSGSMERIS